MTPQEAIKAMKFYKEKLYNGIFNQFISAFDVAVLALEKQIPKKPEEKYRVPNGSLTFGCCPNCNICVRNDRNSHCGLCGQALDWSDTE